MAEGETGCRLWKGYATEMVEMLRGGGSAGGSQLCLIQKAIVQYSVLSAAGSVPLCSRPLLSYRRDD